LGLPQLLLLLLLLLLLPPAAPGPAAASGTALAVLGLPLTLDFRMLSGVLWRRSWLVSCCARRPATLVPPARSAMARLYWPSCWISCPVEALAGLMGLPLGLVKVLEAASGLEGRPALLVGSSRGGAAAGLAEVLPSCCAHGPAALGLVELLAASL
jgi:hypothetical protein